MLDNITTQSTNENEPDEETVPQDGGAVCDPRSDAAGSAGDDTATGTTTHTEPQEPVIELDEVFGLLKNQRRRDVLRYLREDNAEVRLGELAEEIAARECEKDVSQINSQERKRVYVGLYQCHLPKLADIGVIEYNKPRGIIERGPTFDQVTHYLPADETPVKPDAPERSLVASLSNAVSTGRTFL